jgi:BirA family biotin operon repressor/biotin-[acetyl-CoA-carboxylase] ligase
MGEITSTMDIARCLGRLGATEGTAVIAARQTRGRGRSGREWASPRSSGFYCSILLRPCISAIAFQPMSIAAGLAVCDALDPNRRFDLKIKWPNDIFAADRKLGGILITTELSGSIVESAVLGIGINLLPDAARPSHAISLAELDHSTIEATDLLPVISDALSARYLAILEEDSDRALQNWSDRLAYLDELVVIQDGPQLIHGFVQGIDPAGSLQLQTPSGPKLVTSGDLTCGPKPVRSHQSNHART